MLVICNNCNKKFTIEDKLIPDSGRLLQCGSCEHKWFFKNEVVNNEIDDIKKVLTDKNNEINIYKQKKYTPKSISNDKTEEVSEKFDKSDTEHNYKIKKINFFKTFLVFVITLISVVLIFDTFKEPLSIFIPNIKTLLNNLYLTLNDIFLFFKDLTK